MKERTEYFPGDTVKIGEREFVLPEYSTKGAGYRIRDVFYIENRYFTKYGELDCFEKDFGSLFTLVKRAPRKVTKTIEAWAALKNESYYLYSSEELAKKYYPFAKAYVKLTGTYEVEE